MNFAYKLFIAFMCLNIATGVFYNIVDPDNTLLAGNQLYQDTNQNNFTVSNLQGNLNTNAGDNNFLNGFYLQATAFLTAAGNFLSSLSNWLGGGFLIMFFTSLFAGSGGTISPALITGLKTLFAVSLVALGVYMWTGRSVGSR